MRQGVVGCGNEALHFPIPPPTPCPSCTLVLTRPPAVMRQCAFIHFRGVALEQGLKGEGGIMDYSVGYFQNQAYSFWFHQNSLTLPLNKNRTWYMRRPGYFLWQTPMDLFTDPLNLSLSSPSSFKFTLHVSHGTRFKCQRYHNNKGLARLVGTFGFFNEI